MDRPRCASDAYTRRGAGVDDDRVIVRTALALGAAGCFVAGSMFMKPSAGFTRLWPSLAVFVCFAIGITLDVFLVRARGEVGSAVVLIVGLEAAFSAVIARWLFGEPFDRVRVLAMALVLAGVVLLEWQPAAATGRPPAPPARSARSDHPAGATWRPPAGPLPVEPVAQLGPARDAELRVHPLEVRVDRAA